MIFRKHILRTYNLVELLGCFELDDMWWGVIYADFAAKAAEST